MLKIAYSDIFRYSVPEKHRFPMQKYTMIPERLLAEGTINNENFFRHGVVSFLVREWWLFFLHGWHLQWVSLIETVGM